MTSDVPAPTSTPARPPRPERGQELELRIDSLAFGGDGVARTDGGYVLFVRDAVPGDRVRAVVTKRKRHYGEARALEVLEPSPDRVAPLADHPGAPWQVLPYERQLEIKAEQVDDALRRIGHLDGFELAPIVPAVEQWRYRNKLEFSFGTGADGELVCGFHAPGLVGGHRRRRGLPAAVRARQRGPPRGAGLGRAQGLSAYDRRTQRGRAAQPRHPRGPAHRRAAGAASSPATRRARRRRRFAQAVDAESLLLTRTDDRRRDDRRRPDRARCTGSRRRSPRRLGGLRSSSRAEAFFQTNTEMAEQLYAIAGRVRRRCRAGSACTTCSAASARSACRSRARAGEVWGLEIVEEAIADAIANAAANEISNAQFFAGDVRLALRELVERAGRPDVLVVDPPRAGLSQKVVRRIIEAAPRRIVYVSCNPTTLAPNAAQLVEAGYALRRVRPVDMFPQTPHIECVALLERVA